MYKKIFLITSLLFSICAISTPPSPPPGCDGDPDVAFYHAVILKLFEGIIVGNGCGDSEQDPFNIGDPSFIHSGKLNFTFPANGFEYITHMKIIPPLIIDESIVNSYFHFMEVSQDSSTGDHLPKAEAMILDAVIAYNHLASPHYSLVINYNTAIFPGSYSIPISNDELDFELSIAWTTTGCVDNVMPNCSQSSDLGQIVIKRNYDGYEIEERIDGLNFLESSGSGFNQITNQWKAKGVYWGQLDVSDFQSLLELTVPDRYSYGDVTVITD